MSDWSDLPEWEAYEEHAREELIPKMADSSVHISFWTGNTIDVKFATELGVMLMLDKPIVLMVTPGVQVPGRLVQIANAVIEADLDDAPGTAHRLAVAMKNLGLDE